MSFEEFHGGHLGYWKGNIFNNSESLCHSDASHQVSAQSNLQFGRCHLKNFKMAMAYSESVCHSDVSHQISAQSNLQFGRCCLKNFKMPQRQPSWILEWKDFSNSESPCSYNASHEVSPQSDFQFWRRCCKCENGRQTTGQGILTVWEMSFEEFQDGSYSGHLGYWKGMILAILNLCVSLMPPIKFLLNPTYSFGVDVV